ncbi:MAG: T9SS type A sorting domain-containing protein [Saprospiraceae bacterium]|nr:T9SS type A sorting domain-containing protein [Saprospiraceae bacterium]
MWKGIVLLGSAKLFFLDCRVEDAEYAVHVRGAAELSLAGNTFNRNHKGIFIDPSQPLLPNAVNVIAFENNTFTCTAPLNAPYTGQPDPGAVSYAGIDAANCSITLGSENFTNTFTLMKRGITTKNAIVGVRNCLFLEMADQAGNTNDSYGIYASGGSLTVTGERLTATLFRNCGDFGIYTQGVNLTVEHCFFREFNRMGIFSEGNIAGEQILLFDNRLFLENGCVAGIHVEAPVGGPTYTISSNKITITETDHLVFGIRALTPQNVFGAHPGAISKNNLTVNGALKSAIGIIVEGEHATNYYVGENIIHFNGAAPPADPLENWWGIALVGAVAGGNNVSFNTVTGTSGLSHITRCAIHVSNSPHTQLCKNAVNHTYHGFHFIADNADSELSENTIGEHSIGLQIEGQYTTAGIGEQIRRHNVWTAPAWGYAAWAVQCEAPVSNSLFFVENNTPTLMPVPRNPVNGWFDVDNEGETNWCTALRPAEKITSIEQRLLGGSLTLPPVPYWELKRQLVLKLALHPEAMPIGSAAHLFYTTEAANSAGQLAQAAAMSAFALQIPDSIRQILSILNQDRLGLTDSIFAWEDALSLLEQDTTVNQALAAAKAPLLEALESLRLQELQIKEALRAVRLPLLQQAQSINAAVSVSEVWEINRKAITDYTIRRAMYWEEPPGIELITAIAWQVPNESGDAVYAARGFVNDPVLLALWMEEGHSPAMSPSEIITPAAASPASEWRVWPNPAASSLQVQLPTGIAGRITLLDLWGRQMYSRVQRADEDLDTLNIAVQEWQPGIYFCVFQPEAGAVFSTLVIIQ